MTRLEVSEASVAIDKDDLHSRAKNNLAKEHQSFGKVKL